MDVLLRKIKEQFFKTLVMLCIFICALSQYWGIHLFQVYFCQKLYFFVYYQAGVVSSCYLSDRIKTIL